MLTPLASMKASGSSNSNGVMPCAGEHRNFRRGEKPLRLTRLVRLEIRIEPTAAWSPVRTAISWRPMPTSR